MPKTTEIRPRKETEMVKPQEMIEMVEMSPLSLTSRRIYNLLVKHAWEHIDTEKQHSIPKKLLRHGPSGIKTNATERLGQNIKELMSVIVERRNGQQVHRFHLLGYNVEDDEDDDNTLFHYTFPEPLRKIIRSSEVWARLESHVIYAFSSKYSLALYELMALRCNLKHKTTEVFLLEKFRSLLGVEKDKLTLFKSLKQRAIDHAVREVNGLCPDFNVGIEPVLTGRKVTAVKVTWWPKVQVETTAALRELTTSKIGRQERLSGVAEKIVEPPLRLGPAEKRPAPKVLTEQEQHKAAKARLKQMHPQADVEEIYSSFNRAIYTGQHPEPENFVAAFIAFGRKQARKAGV
jgi:hypothetical protein